METLAPHRKILPRQDGASCYFDNVAVKFIVDRIRLNECSVNIDRSLSPRFPRKEKALPMKKPPILTDRRLKTSKSDDLMNGMGLENIYRDATNKTKSHMEPST